MKTTVTAVQGAGTFESKFGLLYKYEYTFADGVTLTANHKKEGGNFNVGDEVEYEIKGKNDYGSWGKVTKPDFENRPSVGTKFTGNKDRIIARQSSLKVALDYLHQKGFNSTDQVDQLQELTYVAEFITDYVLSDSDGTTNPAPKKSEKVPQNGSKYNEQELSALHHQDLERQKATAHLGEPDDLPF